MNDLLQIKLTDNAEALLAAAQDLPASLARAVAAAMDRQNQFTIARIQRGYLSFPKDQKPTPLGLRVITNRLRGSVRASKTVIEDGAITTAIGSNVKYAAIHEFGGTLHRTVKPGSVRLRTNAQGELLRQPGRRGAIFAGRRHKRAKEVAFGGGKNYSITIPARAPFRKGITDQMPAYGKAIGDSIVAALQGGAS